MAQQTLSAISTWPVEEGKLTNNFNELYAMKHPTATTAANDFSIGDGSTWVTRTLAQTKVILGVPAALADLTADATHRVVTDVEKASWTAKAEKLRTEVVVPTNHEFTQDELSRTVITNEGQNPANDIANTITTLVAGLDFDIIITETINSTHYWQMAVPVGTSILLNGVMGTNGGKIRFTAASMGASCRCRTVTINGGVVLVCESAAASISAVI